MAAGGCWATVCSACCPTVRAYWALIENSDPGSEGGPLTNRLHSQETVSSQRVRWHAKIKHVRCLRELRSDERVGRHMFLAFCVFPPHIFFFFLRDFPTWGRRNEAFVVCGTPAENVPLEFDGRFWTAFLSTIKRCWLTKSTTKLAVATKPIGGLWGIPLQNTWDCFLSTLGD